MSGKDLVVADTRAVATQANQLLLDAANFFESGGNWCQNAMQNSSGGGGESVCLVGSLTMMETGYAGYSESTPQHYPMTVLALAKLSDALRKNQGREPAPARLTDTSRRVDFNMVSNWNDDKERSKQDVIALLRQAATE